MQCKESFSSNYSLHMFFGHVQHCHFFSASIAPVYKTKLEGCSPAQYILICHLILKTSVCTVCVQLTFGLTHNQTLYQVAGVSSCACSTSVPASTKQGQLIYTLPPCPNRFQDFCLKFLSLLCEVNVSIDACPVMSVVETCKFH